MGPSLTLDLGGGSPLGEGGQVAAGLQILALLTVLTLAPAILIMLTSFTRIIVVLGFVRRALSTQEVPPTQVLIGLALFLTFFVMAPTWAEIHKRAIRPYLDQEITMPEMLREAEGPAREFLLNHTRKSDLALFIKFPAWNGRERATTSPHTS